MKKIFCLLVLILWTAVPCRIVFAGDLSQKRVMVVHSYHKTQKGHVVEMARGVEQAFAGTKIVLRHEYMDTKRHPDLDFKIKAGLRAVEAMKGFGPDVVIALDDNAQSFFVKKAMAVENAPIFIFGGVNAKPSLYGYPRDNVTGVVERPNIRESFELLLKIRPEIKRVAMLSDNSRTSDLFVAYSKTLDLPVDVVAYVQPATLGQWQAVINTYKDKVDAFGVYLLRTVRRTPGKADMVPEEELIEMLNETCGLPTAGFFDTVAQSGVLCGISVSMEEQGYEAGRIARAVLEGQSVAAFPIQSTLRGRIQLNLKTAERLGVDLSWKIISKADVVIR